MSVKLNEAVFCSTNVALNWFSGPLTVLLKRNLRLSEDVLKMRPKVCGDSCFSLSVVSSIYVFQFVEA